MQERIGSPRRGRRRPTVLALAATLVAAALLAAACGDSDDAAADGGGGSTTTTEGSTTTSGDPVADATARLQPWIDGTFRDPPTDGPTAQTGKKITVVSCGQLLESCSVLVDGVMEGAEAIGWDATMVDTKLDFAAAGDAVRQAMASGASGAVVVGVDCQYLSAALDEAKAADFPVVALNGFDCDVTSDGEEPARYAAQVDFTEGDLHPIDTAHEFAAAKADWATVATDGQLKAINLQQEDLLATKLLGEGFAMGVERCATCEIVDTVTFSTTDLLDGTFNQKLANSLTQHPEANVVNFPFAATITLGTAGLRDANRPDLTVLGAEGLPTQYQLLQDGTIDMVMATPTSWSGWAAVDTLNRIMAGEDDLPDQGVGYQLLTAADIDGTDFAGPVDFRTAYRTVWGVD